MLNAAFFRFPRPSMGTHARIATTFFNHESHEKHKKYLCLSVVRKRCLNRMALS